MCHEVCNREPCNEPCNNRLICGHFCIGFCGEPCPNLCLQCNSDQVTDAFFGTEQNPNVRFVYLPDCGHLFESSGLDNFIKSQYLHDLTEKKYLKMIKLPECPKCNTIIREHSRYAKIIKKQLKLIELVKVKYEFNSLKNIDSSSIEKKIENSSFSKAKLASKVFGYIYSSKILKIVNNNHLNDSNMLENEWNLFELLGSLEYELFVESSGIDPWYYGFVKFEILKIKKILDNDDSSLNRITNDQLNDIFIELNRIEALINLIKFKIAANNNDTIEKNQVNGIFKSCIFNNTNDDKKYENHVEIAQVLAKLEDILFGRIYRCDEIDTDMRNYFNKLNSLIPLNLAFKNYRLNLKNVFDFRRTQWLYCYNKHLFFVQNITDISHLNKLKCPHCKLFWRRNENGIYEAQNKAGDCKIMVK